jgi:hypothetical protein
MVFSHKNNEILALATTWTNLDVKWSNPGIEIKCCMILLLYGT